MTPSPTSSIAAAPGTALPQPVPSNDWRSSGSPSSPKVTWDVAPRLGWAEVGQYLSGMVEGVGQGVAGAAAGAWQLITSPIDSVKDLVMQPGATLTRAGQAMQQRTGGALNAARQGDFQPAGRQLGGEVGAAAGGNLIGVGAGVGAGVVVSGVAALARSTVMEGRMARAAEASRPQRIENNHGRDAPLDAVEAVLQRPLGRLTETEAHAEALRLERLDGGHSYDRHGPQLTPADHVRRITTGVAADEKFSPTKLSTQFHSSADWLMTREKALRFAETRYGIEAGRPPDLAKGQPSSYQIVLEYNRPIDSGAIGVGPTHRVRHPQSGVLKTMPSASQPISGVTRTRTVVAWNPTQQKWVVKQHMPWAEGWDDAKQAYKPNFKADTQRVALYAID